MMVHEEAVSAGNEAEADEALVERTVKLISEQDPKKTESLAAIGEHVLDAYFGGDAGRVAAKQPVKDKSFARLAERAKEETSLRKRSLHRAVTLAIVWRSLSPQVRERLEPAHLEELGTIDDLAKRRELAARVAAGELKGKALRAAIKAKGVASEPAEAPAPEHGAHKMSE